MKLRQVIIILLAWALLGLGQAMAQITEGDDGPIRLGRFFYEGKARYGFLSVGGIHELDRSFFEDGVKPTGRVIPLKDVKILAPVIPSKVIGIALNDKSHGGTKSKEPKFFAKLPSAIIGQDAEIIPPPGSSDLHYEGEVVVVIGTRARNVSRKDALKYVLGVTAGNDITERGYPLTPFDILRAKGADSMSPLGPWIALGLSVERLGWQTRVNGQVVQKSSTRKLQHSVASIISNLSRYMTLEPGDVIYTGTVGKTRKLKPGDVVEVSVEGVGTLRNSVKAP